MENPLTTVANALGRSADTPDRAFRLRRDEHVPDGIRRIARGQLEDAHEELSRAPDRKLAEAVHATRKRLKRLRATVRLSRDAIGEQTYERENSSFRAAGRKLSAGRDAQVRLDTLDDLRERFAGELPEDATARLRLLLDNERDHAEASLRDHDSDTAEVLSAVQQGIAQTPTWTFERDDFRALSPGLRRIYRRGRKRMRAARKDPTPENLHEWRKRVKDLWHATQIVRCARPKRLKRFAKRAHALADVLGDRNDLELLRDYIETHPQCFHDDDARQALVAVIDRRAAVLRDKAFKRGKRLYSQSPKRFVRDVERGWRKHAAPAPQPRPG